MCACINPVLCLGPQTATSGRFERQARETAMCTKPLQTAQSRQLHAKPQAWRWNGESPGPSSCESHRVGRIWTTRIPTPLLSGALGRTGIFASAHGRTSGAEHCRVYSYHSSGTLNRRSFRRSCARPAVAQRCGLNCSLAPHVLKVATARLQLRKVGLHTAPNHNAPSPVGVRADGTTAPGALARARFHPK